MRAAVSRGLSGVNAAALGLSVNLSLKNVANATYPRVTVDSLPDELLFTNPLEYLRQALNGANWDLVSRWYATSIQEILTRSSNASQFFDLSQLDLQVYSDRRLGIGDLKALTEKCIYSMVVSDLGTKVGFGTDKRLSDLGNPNVGYWFSALLYGDEAGYLDTVKAVKGFTGEGSIVYVDAGPPVVDTYTIPAAEAPPIYVAESAPPVYVPDTPYVPEAPVYDPYGYYQPYSYDQLSLQPNFSYYSGFAGISDIPGPRNYRFCLGWVKEPKKHTASRIIVAAGAAFIGAAAFSAISSSISAATSGVGTSAGTAASTGATSVATSGAIAAPVIETVVVTAAAPAIISSAAIGAGVVSGAAAAVIPTTIETVTVSAPQISAAAVSPVVTVAAAPALFALTPSATVSAPIETVVTEASALPNTSIAESIASGAVAVASAAPALLAPAIQAPIETVTVEGARPVEAPLSLTSDLVSALSVIEPLLTEPISLSEPEVPDIEDETTLDKLKSQLKSALESFGADYLKSQLQKFLAEKLKREPSAEEIDFYDDYLDSLIAQSGPIIRAPLTPGKLTSNTVLIIGIVLALVIVILKNSRKKRRGKRND